MEEDEEGGGATCDDMMMTWLSNLGVFLLQSVDPALALGRKRGHRR